MNTDTDNTFNKISIEGCWDEIVDSLQDVDDIVDDEDFNSWIPDESDDLNKEQVESTAEQATSDKIPLPNWVEKGEKLIYKYVVTPFNKHYFSGSDVDATLDEDGEKYECEVFLDDDSDFDEVTTEVADN